LRNEGREPLWLDVGTCWISDSGRVLVLAMEELMGRYFVIDIEMLGRLFKRKEHRVQIREKNKTSIKYKK
jgi:hypothetical protein